MGENGVQSIEPSPISLVKKRVESISFDGGAPSEEQETIKGEFNITNSITSKIEAENGEQLLHAKVRVSVKPEEGYCFYSIDLSVTGVFAKNDEGISDDEFERSVLTDGVAELYAFAREVSSILTRGGLFGDVKFPILRITI